MNNANSNITCYKINRITHNGVVTEAITPLNHLSDKSDRCINHLQERMIHEHWRPSCHKSKIDENRFQVSYQGNMIISRKNDDTEIPRDIFAEIGKKVLLVGGHYMPDIRDLKIYPNQPLQALKKTFELAKNFSAKKPDLLILINDLNLGHNAISSANNRKEIIDDYFIPEKLHEEIEMNKEFINNVFFINERKLFLKLNRERHHLLKNNKLIKKNSMYMLYGNGIRDIIISNREDDENKGYYRCVGAVTRLLKMADDMGYDGVLQVYPVCSVDTVEKGLQHARFLYDVKLKVLTVYKTFTCFSNSTYAY